MRLYELDDALRTVIDGGLVFDEETGEVLFDSNNLDELQRDLADKLEACALVVKDYEAEAEAIKAEEKRLSDRRKRAERRAESLKGYILEHIDSVGGSLSTAKAEVKARKSSYVDIDDGYIPFLPAEFLAVEVSQKPKKAEIRKALQSGVEIPGCELSERRTISIK